MYCSPTTNSFVSFFDSRINANYYVFSRLHNSSSLNNLNKYLQNKPLQNKPLQKKPLQKKPFYTPFTIFSDRFAIEEKDKELKMKSIRMWKTKSFYNL